MTDKIKTNKRVVFLENPFDIETVFESLSVATDHEKELLFMDRLLAIIRLDSTVDITTACYNILRELNILTLKRK